MSAQDSSTNAPSASSSVFKKDETDRAVDKAIKFLVKNQKGDGAIFDKGHHTTMTSLTIMAMAGVGIQPVDPTPEGKSMAKALAYVLRKDRVDDKGYFGRADGSRMYGHGITTLMLTEMLGMGVSDEQDKLIHDRCEKAIDVILSAQKHPKAARHRGGWRYEPSSGDADLSVSVWQLMALRSAKNDGLKVPVSAIEKAVTYLQRSFVSPIGRNGVPEIRVSGFTYMPRQTRASEIMTAAGLLAMQVCGQYKSPFVTGASEWLLKRPPKWGKRFFFYGIYYYAQGMYQRGGTFAKTARKHVVDVLMPKQQKDGSWLASNRSERGVGKVYATSMAVLSLSVKHHFLPIYQR